MASSVEAALAQALEARRRRGLLRSLSSRDAADGTPLVDFCSNDYLGLSRNEELRERIDVEVRSATRALRRGAAALGSSGSRLLSGNNAYAEEVEAELARFFSREAALLFTSGYDANLSLMASLPQKPDVVLFDELCHNSLREGMRLGRQRASAAFRHNDVASLRGALRRHAPAPGAGCVFVVVESVYSMDGDVCPLREVCDLAAEFGPHVSVVCDEAHGSGVFGARGEGVAAMQGVERHPALLCTMHTFGKALGSHGAAVAGSAVLKSYLINYARALVYTTALPLHSIASIRCAVRFQAERGGLRADLSRRIASFAAALRDAGVPPGRLLTTQSPIQAVLAPGNARVARVAAELRRRGHDVLAIRAPTVAEGTERLRIIVHAHNTDAQIADLAAAVAELVAAPEPPPTPVAAAAPPAAAAAAGRAAALAAAVAAKL